MKLLYKNNKVSKICEDIREATSYFGGNKDYAISLMARINALKQAEDIRDIIALKQMRFHKLVNKGNCIKIQFPFTMSKYNKIIIELDKTNITLIYLLVYVLYW